MKNLTGFLFILLVLGFAACEKEKEATVKNSDMLIGFWINPVAIDSFWKYERADSLKYNGYGFAFKPQQLFVERKNAGWCGTPPIVYDNFNGTWVSTDSLVNITVDYWGGTAKYKWKVISVNNINLVIYKVKEEFLPEEK